MKNLDYLVSQGRKFLLDDQNPFLISMEDVQQISRLGVLLYTFFKATMSGLLKDRTLAHDLLFDGLEAAYGNLLWQHPERHPTLIRVDLMVDINGAWKIAEIDPSNKHGMGFALACRYESGAGERQKLLSLLAPYVTSDVIIVLGRKESFYTREQKFFAGKLAEYTGKKVVVVPEDNLTLKIPDETLILDFPFCGEDAWRVLSRQFCEKPESFINPPRHALGGKALMTLPYEHAEWLEEAGMERVEIEELKTYLPPTYSGPFVGKEVFSSGAKGVFFDAVDKKTVFQKYIEQRAFRLNGECRFIRTAAHFVGSSLGELTVSATTTLPVHGGNDTMNYHVGIGTPTPPVDFSRGVFFD